MKILVGVNGGDEQRDAVAFAARLARVEGGRLIVAHAYPWSRLVERFDAPSEAELRSEAEAIVDSAREQLGDISCETRLLPTTSAPHALHDLARDAQVDVLVIGSSHRGRLRRATIGGVGDRLVHGATCPVAVAPRGYDAAPDPLQRIGVGYDARAESQAALDWARDLALRSGASLALVQSFTTAPVAMYPGFGVAADERLTRSVREEAERSVRAAVARLPQEVRPEGRIVEGAPGEALATAATDLGLDLLVVGSRGYGAVGALLLGRTSRALVHDAPCPVVVLPRTAVWEPEPAARVEAVATG